MFYNKIILMILNYWVKLLQVFDCNLMDMYIPYNNSINVFVETIIQHILDNQDIIIFIHNLIINTKIYIYIFYNDFIQIQYI